MFLELLADILIPSLGIALSPIPILAITLVLGSPNSQKKGIFFALGWILGLLILCSVLFIATESLENLNIIPSIIESFIRIVLGILLVFFALKKWKNRPKVDEEPKMPKFLNSISKANSKNSFKHGVILSALNPKNIAFCLVSVASVTYLGLEMTANITAIVIFIIFSSLTVLIPLFFYIFYTDLATKKLSTIKGFTVKNNSLILSFVLLLIGLILLKNGIFGII